MIRFWRDRLRSVWLAAIGAIMSFVAPKMAFAAPGTGTSTAFIGHNSIAMKADLGTKVYQAPSVANQQVTSEAVAAHFGLSLAANLTVVRSPAAKSTVETFVVSSLAMQYGQYAQSVAVGWESVKFTTTSASNSAKANFPRSANVNLRPVGGAALPTGGKPDQVSGA